MPDAFLDVIEASPEASSKGVSSLPSAISSIGLCGNGDLGL